MTLFDTWDDFVERRMSGLVDISQQQIRNYKTFQWAKKNMPELLNEGRHSYEHMYEQRKVYLRHQREIRKNGTSPLYDKWSRNNKTINGAVDPVKVEHQTTKRPPETAKTKHQRVKNKQFKTTIYTNSLDQKTRRENIAAGQPDHLAPRKDVTPSKKVKRAKNTPKAHTKALNTPGPRNIDPFGKKPIAGTITLTDKDMAQLSQGRYTNQFSALDDQAKIRPRNERPRQHYTGYRKQRIAKGDKLSAHQINREKLANYLRGKKNQIADYKFVSGKVKGFLKNPWTRKALAFGASIAMFNIVTSTLNKLFTPDRDKAIPDYYERGYDNIKERMTDFGSPVNLSKTVAKTITPRYSTARNAMYTTVDSVMSKNIALVASKNAINHTGY